MLIRVMCLSFSAFIVMGCAGSSVADRPDAPTTSHGGATSSQLEPVDSTTGVLNFEVRPNCSATAVAKGNTVDEPTISI